MSDHINKVIRPSHNRRALAYNLDLLVFFLPRLVLPADGRGDLVRSLLLERFRRARDDLIINFFAETRHGDSALRSIGKMYRGPAMSQGAFQVL